MNEHECVKYLLPELKKDVAENIGQTVSRIAWDHPQFWANDLAPWCSVGNINHTQQMKFGIPFINVIQETKNQNEGLLGSVQKSGTIFFLGSFQGFK